MAALWNTEQIIAEYGDLQASAMAVDCLGVWAVLAGRRALTLVDLNRPTEKVIKHSRQSKWDIGCVQWNPHPSHAHMFVTACNQRLDLFSWKEGGCAHKSSMKFHSRTVSDVDWSPFDVNIIASCSVDTFTHLWDVRDPRKPQASFQTVAGASQVMWNKVKNNLFATTHEGDVRIWDPRKGNTALQYIAAHLSKIHGLDWSPNSDNQLATASQDGFIKFWDISNPRQSKICINAGFPVWRARYTPFGHGLVTVTVPQLRRGDNSLYLWNFEGNIQGPVHQFIGHHDVILEFHMRKPQDDRDFQLVTWSKDDSLRIWKIDPQHQRLCGHDVGDVSDSPDAGRGINGSRSLDTSDKLEDQDPPHQSSGSPDSFPGQQPRTLQQEFSLVNIEIPDIHVEEMNPNTRTCIALAMTSNNHHVRLKMMFPTAYPNDVPTFEFMHSNVSTKVQEKLHKVLSVTSQKHVKRNTNCLEPCLRKLATTLNSLMIEERRTPDTEIPAPLPYPLTTSSHMQMNSLYLSLFVQDNNIPFPRTSGARFCAAGYLVVFGRAKEAKKARSGAGPTPKSLSELNQIVGNRGRIRTTHHQPPTPYQPFASFARSPPTSSSDAVTIKSYYYKADQKKTQKPRGKKKIPYDKLEEKESDKSQNKPKIGLVKVYDGSFLMPINKFLGENYMIDRLDIPRMCSHNAKMATTAGRKDLIQLWSLISRMADSHLTPHSSPDSGIPWGCHPFGRKLLQKMMQYYSNIHDVQTLAMLCCVFWNRQEIQKKIQQSTSMDYIPHNDENEAYHPSSTSPSPLSEVASHPNLAALYHTAALKLKRSSSWSHELESFEDYRFDDERDLRQKEQEKEEILHKNNCRVLDPGGQLQYDQFLKAYANILFHWGLKNQATKMLKFVSTSPATHKGIEFGLNCCRCRKEVRGPQCGSCKILAFNCSICHIGVRGASNFCLTCGHGGHTNHILEWFQNFDECPTGCGCKCTKGKTYITMVDNT